MIHYTCDFCHRSIDNEEEPRFVVRLEVYPAVDAADSDLDADRDNLEAIDEMLERLDEVDLSEEIDSDYEQIRYDLCQNCRRELLKNPLGRLAATKLGFSDN